MLIKSILLFLMRIVAAIIALPISAFAILFGLLLLPTDPGLGEFLRVQIYERWTGVIVCYLLLIAICAGIDYVTGAIKWFDDVPIEIRYIGCAAITLALTMLLSLIGPSHRGPLDHPDWGDYNIVIHEIFLLSPYFMSEAIRIVFRGW